MKEESQIKPMLDQGRAGLRCKIKTLMPTSISIPIVQAMEKTTKSPHAPNT